MLPSSLVRIRQDPDLLEERFFESFGVTFLILDDAQG